MTLKAQTPAQRKGKRSTLNAQRSTFKVSSAGRSPLKVERWKLNVERLPISVSNTTTTHISSYLRTHLQRAHTILKSPLKDLSLALVGDRKMAALHQQFLGIPGPTDVLTFPLELDQKGRPISGEVVICVPEARRRCGENGGSLRKELLLYALHGLLHLNGFDDRTKSEFQRMHRKEDQILNQLGVGPVFSRI